MRDEEIARLKKVAREEYERDRAALEQQYKARLQAIEWVAQQKGAPASSSSSVHPSTEVTPAVREVVQEFPKSFSRPDVEQKLKQRLAPARVPSRAVVAKTLARLVDEGTLRITRQGRGRRATLYKCARAK